MCSHEVQQLSDSAHKNVSGHLHPIKSLPKICPIKITYLKADVKFKTTVTHN